MAAIDLVRDWPRSFGWSNTEVGATDGTRLRLVVGGSGPDVVLLHGAPQFSYAWRKVMQRLQDRYRVIAVDLRGYGASELPANDCYEVDTLVDDLGVVIRCATGASKTKPIVVGHDWGGPIVWAFAQKYPDMVRHLVVVNGPHPAVMARELTRPRQLIRSWYIAMFQLPLLEVAIERTHASLFLWMIKTSSPPGTFDAEDLDHYRAAFDREGRARAVLMYYRQAFGKDLLQKRQQALASPMITVPATVVWGEADSALHPVQAEGIRRYVENVDIRMLPGVSHWVPEQDPESVVQAVVDADHASARE